MGESLFETFRNAMFEELRKVAKSLDEVLSFEVYDETVDMGRFVIFWGNRVCMVTPAQVENALQLEPDRWAMFIVRQVQKIRGKGLTNPYGNPNIFRVDHVLKFQFRMLCDILASHPSMAGVLESAEGKLEQITGGEKLSDAAKYRQLNRFLVSAIKDRLRPKVGRPKKETE